MSDRPFDVVLLGATGFTGRQTAHYFATHVPRDTVRWALAGRSKERLEAVRTGLGPAFADLPLLTVDTLNADAVSAMVRQTRIVLTTVGPYARYGDAVVEHCVAHGTHYVDITGETAWVREQIDRHHAHAVADGTRIVPFCGFDSVPSDLGTWMLTRHIRDRWGEPTRDVRAAFRTKGAFNGGTLASALDMAASGGQRRMGDLFLLNPDFRAPRDLVARCRDRRSVGWDGDLNAWLAPFLMGAINSRVVRRSAALLAERGEGYGPDFAYSEAMKVPGRVSGAALSVGLAAGPALLMLGPVRTLAARWGPSPGEGPSEAAMDGGFFSTEFVGIADNGIKVRARVAGQGDPGNRSTVRMLCESALCLALQEDELPPGGGVLTPAAAFGAVLLARLRAAGMTFAIQEGDQEP
jgi:short subunit dehydrogenase-like uncharacterized protein